MTVAEHIADTPSTPAGAGEPEAPAAQQRPLNLLGPAAFAVAATVYVWTVALPFVRMPARAALGWAADDGCYYLQIARNIAAGHGSTLDGISPTNGYHPAWMALIVVLAKFVHGRYALFHDAMAAEFVADAVAAVLLVLLLRPITGQFWAWIGGALWLMNPLAISMTTCLTEAPLCIAGVIFALLCIQRTLHTTPAQRPLPAGALVWCGFGLGIAVLTRTDGAIFAALAILFLIRRQIPGMSLRGAARAGLRTGLLCGGACAATVSPWLAYSWLTVHSLSQDSGVIKALWQQPNIAHVPMWRLVALGLDQAVLQWLWGTLELTVGNSPAPATAVAIFVVCAAATGATLARRSPAAAPMRSMTLLLLATGIATGFAYIVGFAGAQLWHLAEPALVVWLIAFAWIALLFRVKASAPVQAIAGIAAVIYTALAWGASSAHLTPRYPWQRDVYDSLPAFDRLVPPQEKIGCFNAGIPAYFGHRTVVDLDGLVNHDAVPYWLEHRFSAYVKNAGIHYIADEGYSISLGNYFSRRPLRLHVIAVHRLTDPIRPWRYLCRVE